MITDSRKAEIDDFLKGCTGDELKYIITSKYVYSTTLGFTIICGNKIYGTKDIGYEIPGTIFNDVAQNYTYDQCQRAMMGVHYEDKPQEFPQKRKRATKKEIERERVLIIKMIDPICDNKMCSFKELREYYKNQPEYLTVIKKRPNILRIFIEENKERYSSEIQRIKIEKG